MNSLTRWTRSATRDGWRVRAGQELEHVRTGARRLVRCVNRAGVACEFEGLPVAGRLREYVTVGGVAIAPRR